MNINWEPIWKAFERWHDKRVIADWSDQKAKIEKLVSNQQKKRERKPNEKR